MGAIQGILEGKDRTVHSIEPSATVYDAVRRMCSAHVGALVVLDGYAPIGILTERDILTRVVLEQRDPSQTEVAAVMTRALTCIDLETEPRAAMELMTTRRCRHLPVVEEGQIVGIVSIGDLVQWASQTRESEIQSLTEYVTGSYLHIG